MASWPSITTASKVNETTIKRVHRSESEAGYIHTRSKWTGSRKAFGLGWTALTSADKTTLEDFFIANQGTTFDWTHPISSTVYTCIFADDKIQFNSISGRWTCKLTIEEQQ